MSEPVIIKSTATKVQEKLIAVGYKLSWRKIGIGYSVLDPKQSLLSTHSWDGRAEYLEGRDDCKVSFSDILNLDPIELKLRMRATGFSIDYLKDRLEVDFGSFNADPYYIHSLFSVATEVDNRSKNIIPMP